MVVLQLLTYAAVVWFVVVVARKAWHYASAPMHLRWELYPVAHEPGFEHGGSHYEHFEFWNKERKPNKLNELAVMAKEILLLEGVREHNKPMWYWSLPFHLGVYGMIGVLKLMVLLALLMLVGVTFDGVIGQIIHVLIMIAGYAGFVLVVVGGAGLLARRLSDPDLKRMSAPIDYCNLLFFMLIGLVGLISRVAGDPRFGGSFMYMYSLVSFSSVAVGLPALVVVEIVLWALMLVYLPVTRMSHFVAKYFAYHQIRWEDTPNAPGSKMEARIRTALNYGVAWSAPHIQTGKTWGEVATEVPQEGSPK